MRIFCLLPLVAALVSIAFAPSLRASQNDDPLLPSSNRTALRGVATELSKLGMHEAVERMNDALRRAGEPPKALARLQKSWEKNLARSRRGKSPKSTLARLEKQVSLIAEMLEDTAEPRRTGLIELLLGLDSQEARANQALGHVLLDGRWQSPSEVEEQAGKRRVADLVQEAHRLEVKIETGESNSHVFEVLHMKKGVFASAHGVSIHASTDQASIERILRQALRATALSNALLADVLAVPPIKRAPPILFMASASAYDAALVEARDNGGLMQAAYDRQVNEVMRSFLDRRGWRTSRWRMEADSEALALWTLLDQTLGRAPQPCLKAGHLNWLSLEFLGTSMPIVAWTESTETGGGRARTSVKEESPFRAEVLLRSALHTLYGCRSWMVHQVVAGKDPPWSRSMLDQVGKVTNENLLKATLVNAYLQETGALRSVLDETRGRRDRVAAFEASLSMRLPEFEEGWKRWLLDLPPFPPGVVQLVTAAQGAEVDDPQQAALLKRLNGIRSAAFEGQMAEFEMLGIDDELSDGALAHARYLGLNEGQKDGWPEAHEEYADSEGFTPEGSRAGLHGLIAFTDDPVDAVTQWMSTFYHRLPLLNPGLFGVGFGLEGGVAILDVTSLVLKPWRDHWVVWPHDGMRAVPLSFVPELPNPVPGEDQSQWGYPITLQVFLGNQDREIDVSMKLFEDGIEGSEVECWFLCPDKPYSRELVPKNTWSLIPRKQLKRGTKYTVVATIADPIQTKMWSFETE